MRDNYGDIKEIFLTVNDEKKMLTETAPNIRMEKKKRSMTRRSDHQTRKIKFTIF